MFGSIRLCLAIGLVILPELLSAESTSRAAFEWPVASLSNQDSRPFVYASRVVTSKSGGWPKYEAILEEYWDARPCLMTSEQGKDVVDLLQIDWSKPETGTALNVCLFRIFSSLDDPDLIERWLAEHGFEVVPLQQTSEPEERNPYRRVKVIFGRWRPEQFYVHYPSLLYSLTGFTFLRIAEISISLSNEDKVLGVRMYAISK